MPTRISLQDPTLHIGTTIRIMEGHMTNAQISHSIEVRENDLEMNLPAIRMETGGTMTTSLVLRRLKEESSQKINPTANQEVINLITPPSADLTIDLRLALPL